MLETTLQENLETQNQRHILFLSPDKIVCTAEQVTCASSRISFQWTLHKEVTLAEKIESLLHFYVSIKNQSLLFDPLKQTSPKASIKRNGVTSQIPFEILFFEGDLQNYFFYGCDTFHVSTPYAEILLERISTKKNIEERFKVISLSNLSIPLAEFISSTGAISVGKNELESSLQRIYTSLLKDYLQ